MAINLSDTSTVAHAVFSEVQETLRSAIQTDVVVYAVDPRGLVGIFDQADAANQRLQRDFLSALSLDTEGRAIVGNSQISEGLEGVLRENGSYYVLGYVPEPPFGTDGSIQSSSKREMMPGAFRRVADIWRRRDPTLTTSRTTRFESALAGTFPVTDVPMRVTAAATALAPRDRAVIAITSEVGTGHDEGEWDLAIRAFTHEGRELGATSKTTGSLSTPDGAPRLIREQLELPAGIVSLRVGVLNSKSGARGSVYLPVEVPNLYQDRLIAGGISLGSIGNREAVADIERAFEPAVERTYNRDQLPYVRLPFFWPAKQGSSVEVFAELTDGAGHVVRRRDTITATSEGPRRRAAFSWDLSATTLAPGDYLLTVQGRLKGKTARQAVRISVK